MAVGEQAPSGDELLSFESREGDHGLRVVDRIERRHLSIETPEDVSPRRVSSDVIHYPVDEAVTVETDRLFVPYELCVVVWNSLGLMIAEIASDDTRRFPRDAYVLELPAPIRLYLAFDAGCSIDMCADGVTIDLDAVVDVQVGARSEHKRPAATVTTTEDVEDLMCAISTFGSALKSTSCERSYPSHRGHPPALEVGDELDVPPVLSRPDNGITIGLPREYRSVFVGSTLAYYLGAEVVPRAEPHIATDRGFRYPLDEGDRGFEREVERVLKQVFFLDCVTRTEGRYRIDLHERNQIEDLVDLDFAALYDRPMAAQVEAYLDVPYRLVEPLLPTWKMTAHVTPDPRYVETLPFVVNDLAVVRIPNADGVGETSAHATAIADFTRCGEVTRSSRPRVASESAATPSIVRIEEEDSIEQTWIGDGAPIGASKAMIAAFRNRLGRAPSDDDIDITVVCNASEMSQERELVNEVYGSRDELPFDVSIHRELSVRELRTVLERDVDFLHYIGHIDAGGFECTDGRFDAASLERTGVDVFFLNACTSYEQGRRLIEAGGIAGVVTLRDVINSGAERVGMTLARLLNAGFPLRAALDIARRESIMGGHYLVIGDGSIDITQPKGFVPNLCELVEKPDGWRLQWITYPTYERAMGTVTTPFIDGCDEFYLASGNHGTFSMSDDGLRQFFEMEDVPVRTEDGLTWSSEFVE